MQRKNFIITWIMCEKLHTFFFYFEGFPKELTPLTELKSAWQRPECQHKVDPVWVTQAQISGTMISPVTMTLRQNICTESPANQQSRWRRMNGCGDFNSKTSRKLSRCHSLLFAWPVKETKIENFDNSKSAASWWCWVGTCTSQCPTINS